jgi:hypothetical protein
MNHSRHDNRPRSSKPDANHHYSRFTASRHAGPYPIFPPLAELYIADYPGPVGGYSPDLPQV